MKFFLINLLMLTLAWGALTGSFSPLSLLAGAVLGLLVLAVTRPLFESRQDDAPKKAVLIPFRYAGRLGWILLLAGIFLWKLVSSGVRVAYEILHPRLRVHPALIALPLDAKTDLEITVLANLISLTPGTLSLDVSPDRSVLYIHAMYVDQDDADALRAELKQGLERRVRRALGPG